MANEELNKKISQIEQEIKELEFDLYYTRHNVTQELIIREINTKKHVLKQYEKMVK